MQIHCNHKYEHDQRSIHFHHCYNAPIATLDPSEDKPPTAVYHLLLLHQYLLQLAPMQNHCNHKFLHDRIGSISIILSGAVIATLFRLIKKHRTNSIICFSVNISSNLRPMQTHCYHKYVT